MSKPLPSFFLIGVTKGGTTSIYDALEQHPDVFVPWHKEPRYYAFPGEKIVNDPFRRDLITDRDDYLALYKDAKPGQVLGDCSLYLNHPNAAGEIARDVPDGRFVSIFRDPVERAYSHYMFEVQRGLFPASVSFEALAKGEATVRIAGEDRLRDHAYVGAGQYAAMLAPWLERFDRSQHLMLLFEDLIAEPQATAEAVYRHIGVDPSLAEPKIIRRAASGIPKNQAVHALVSAASRIGGGAARAMLPRTALEELRRVQARITNRNLYKPKLEPEVRQRLLPLFREDTLRFQDIIGRDLSAWLR